MKAFIRFGRQRTNSAGIQRSPKEQISPTTPRETWR